MEIKQWDNYWYVLQDFQGVKDSKKGFISQQVLRLL